MLGSLVPWRQRSLFPTTDRFSQTMNQMEEEMEGLMERFWGGNGGQLTTGSGFLPTVDLVETENQFEVTVDLPGLKPDEVNVEFKGGSLWISGKREEEKEEEGKTYHCVERRRGEFRRVLPLPDMIDEEKINAHFENGVLKVAVPKNEEVKTKHIEVES